MVQAKISVLIVTYKQADVIGRNLDSILQQKDDGLFEIVICDDCSPDNNWEIISEYVKRYPSIIRAYRNEKNLGIYGNSNKLIQLRGDADLFCWVEGDDALCSGFFKSIQSFIMQNNININDNLGIFCDWKSVDVEGKEQLYHNEIAISKYPKMGLYLRSLLSWRGSVFSQTLMNNFSETDTSLGLGTSEMLFDIQWFRYLEKSYYLNVPGTLYYSGIGVSKDFDWTSEWRTTDAIKKWKYFKDNELTSKKDKLWADHFINKAQYMIKPSFLSFIKSFYCFCKGSYKENRDSYKKFKEFLYPFYLRIKK